MKKLSRSETQEQAVFIKNLRDKESVINQMIGEANEIIDKINETLQSLETEMNNVESWRDEITSDIDDFMDKRSEKWQESDAADKYRDWRTQFDDIPFAAVEMIEKIEEINIGEDVASYLEENITSDIDNL
jgi:archaellum component FlaC